MIPEPSSLAFFTLLSCFTLFLGWRRGLFSIGRKSEWISPIYFGFVVFVFGIYFGVGNGITPFINEVLKRQFFSSPSPPSLLQLASWLNFINFGLIFLGILLFFFLLPKTLRTSIWKDPQIKHSYLYDITLSLFAWAISFPLVILVNQLCDFALVRLLSVDSLPEQLAVHFLKMTFGHPLSIFLTIFTITIFAPLVEETLFRGFLQSFIRKHLGSKQAIFITSILFAFFHYSPEQKLANFTIIASLFVFSLFLGLVYEKRRSLFASMFLHAVFNTVNVLNLYFLGGIPGGPL